MTIELGAKGGGAESPFFNEAIKANQTFAGKYYRGSVNQIDVTNAASVVNVLTYVPFIPKFSHTFTAIGLVSNTASGSWRLGLYSDDGEGRPGNLLLDAGVIASAVAVLEIAISQALSSNTIYWLAAVTDNTGPVTHYEATIVPGAPPLGSHGYDDYELADKYKGIKEAHTFGALPAVAAADTIATSLPMIFLKG